MRFEGKDLKQLAPSLPLSNGQWLHAFELRFLLSADAYSPSSEKLKNKQAFLIDVSIRLGFDYESVDRRVTRNRPAAGPIRRR